MLSKIVCSVLALLLTISVASTPSLGAEASGSPITGVVKDSQTGEPLPGANVTIAKTSMGASTDVEGRYTIREVAAGCYTLRATYVGYKEKQLTVQVKKERCSSRISGLSPSGWKEKKWWSRPRPGDRKRRSISSSPRCR